MERQRPTTPREQQHTAASKSPWARSTPACPVRVNPERDAYLVDLSSGSQNGQLMSSKVSSVAKPRERSNLLVLEARSPCPPFPVTAGMSTKAGRCPARSPTRPCGDEPGNTTTQGDFMGGTLKAPLDPGGQYCQGRPEVPGHRK